MKTSPLVQYELPGDAKYQAKLYPPVDVLNKSLNLKSPQDVISFFTANSLAADGIAVSGAPKVDNIGGTGRYRISFEALPGHEADAQHYATIHPRLLDAQHAGQAINGVEACQATPGAWNPMEGFPVNHSDGLCKWHLFLPVGLPMVTHKAVTLLHYPPYVAMQSGDYLHNMTLERWQRILKCVGLTEQAYDCILDVNPIAAPGSGQSEYPNDYFPIMLSSVFFDNKEANRDYIRSMLELLLNPPHNDANPYTLPLLIGGSPAYDPQAPGWFRVRYKEFLPKDGNGSPQAMVGQAGAIKIKPESKKFTPYMIANHMIAAGVTGRCTGDPSRIPDIRKYEAQDLVAASFLKQYADNPSIAPAAAKLNACRDWFGADNDAGAPNPAPDKMRLICILSQMDLFFDPVKIAPLYTWDEAAQRCATLSGDTNNPCFGGCAPPPRS